MTGASANARRVVVLAFVAILHAGVPGVIQAEKAQWYTGRDRVALSGYDPVAYFTESRATKGDARIEHEWAGARWRFASDANRRTFIENPAQFAPQFGGYCAWAVSQGYTASADPNAWSVVKGKLYVNYSLSVRTNWERDTSANIAKGERNWPAVLAR